MKISVNNGVPTPQAHVAINKSRLKIYNKDSKTPVFYLQKGQEFQLELFNPTSGTILAKIFLNGNAISQGGLVLRPGERVFLDRYIDVPKKFLFDTYEVSNSEEVRKAIEDNGDFKVEFYRESTQPYYSGYLTVSNINTANTSPITYGSNIGGSYTTTNYNVNSLNTNYFGDNINLTSSLGLTSMSYKSTPEGPNIRSVMAKKSIETGRVEQGSESNQKLKTVDKTFEYFPFHTLEYKLMPMSQKVNTTNDIKVKRYCTNCGSKLGPTHKFCANCGSKA